jgi:multidrug efflux system membrane fusion protein
MDEKNESTFRTGTGTPPPVPPSRRSRLWLWILLAVIFIAGAFIFYRHTHQTAGENAGGGGKRGGYGAAAPPVMISTATAKTGDIGVYITALGTVTPVNTVAIQSRIAGQIMKVNYKEGQLVHAGDSLIEIDSGPYQAAVDQAQGQLVRDTALLSDAKVDLERYKTAFASNAIPHQQYETQVATVKANEGTVQLDQGNLASAKVQLASGQHRAGQRLESGRHHAIATDHGDLQRFGR